LSLELAGKNDQTAIAKILARRLAGLVHESRIVVAIFGPGGEIHALAPEDIAAPPGDAPVTIPLASPRGMLGELRVWKRGNAVLSAEEERLSQTFASQGALALDRAILADSETRARVLEESDRLKTAILASVSHDLRTPLASIEAAATSLFNPQVALEPEARSELQSLLLEETEHMTQLVGNLLNMSRIEAGALKLQRQWNALAEIVDASLRRLRRSLTNHSIVVDVSEDLPFVSVDPVLMEQVVNNLVRNSLKFAPPNTTIRIHAAVEGQTLAVSVSNKGPRIPEEHLEHIFEKFYPIPGKDLARGTGLGLSICKGIVEAHGGTIWAENLAVGVAFRFSLPLTWDGALPELPENEVEGT
jgi:two-component system sensor histidine kinase KdpD